MAPTPRSTLSEDFAAHLNCPICGEARLMVHHTSSLPDYVTCHNCSSAFVVEEGGERVLFGKINDQYPRTQQFALKQWVMLEAVERRASDERLDDEDTTAPPEVEQAPTPPIPEAAPTPQPSVDNILRSAAVPIPTEPDLEWPPEKLIPLEQESEPVQAQRAEPSPPTPASVEPVMQKPVQPSPIPPAPSHPEPPLGVDLDRILRVEEQADEPATPGDTPVFPQGMKPKQPAESPAEPAPSAEAQAEPDSAVQAAPAKPAPEPAALELRENDPPAGIRYRVVIRGEKVVFPKKACAHCQATPVRGRLTIIGDLPQGQKIGQRKKSSFNLPLCAECHDRAQSVTPEEKAERLQANLIAMLVMMVLLVAALAWGLDLQEDPISGVIIIGILALVGYFVPSYFPPSPNAAYIRSTLLIPDDAQGLETAFEFRNKDYAQQFFEANEFVTLGKPIQVKDRSFSRMRPPETPAS
jgi:ribosomal protein S27E